jgi:hypothetical protein
MPTEELSLEELTNRAYLGGVVPGIPALTDEQRTEWTARREASSDWVPQAALRYCWDRVDLGHGHGGRWYQGRERRPGDPDFGDGWSWQGFLHALQADDREIVRVVTKHSKQANRLRDWRRRIEALGRQRNADARVPTLGQYYSALSELGYSGSYD